jgi:hypothetical protein
LFNRMGAIARFIMRKTGFKLWRQLAMVVLRSEWNRSVMRLNSNWNEFATGTQSVGKTSSLSKGECWVETENVHHISH